MAYARMLIWDRPFFFDISKPQVKVFSHIITRKRLAYFEFTYTPTGLVETKRINETSSGVFNTTMTYAYHARDWLTDINDVNSTTKPFAAEYTYKNDGNIQSASFYNQSSPIEQLYKYDFTYDARKQLTKADYFYDNSGWITVNQFDVAGLTYDLNGNITKLNARKKPAAPLIISPTLMAATTGSTRWQTPQPPRPKTGMPKTRISPTTPMVM